MARRQYIVDSEKRRRRTPTCASICSASCGGLDSKRHAIASWVEAVIRSVMKKRRRRWRSEADSIAR